jgi:uncharacterized protein (TIGR03067 family)
MLEPRPWFAFLTLLVIAVPVRSDGEKPTKGQTDLQGTWKVTDGSRNGGQGVQPEFDKITVVVTEDEIRFSGTIRASSYKLDPSKKPKWIDVTLIEDKGTTYKGIYEITGDELKLVWNSSVGEERPEDFNSFGKMGRIYLVLKRQPDKKK